MVQITDKGNINEIDEFLMVHQSFLYQIFLLGIANVVLATVLSIFSPIKNLHYEAHHI